MLISKNRLIQRLITIDPDLTKRARITFLDECKKCLHFLASEGYDELGSAAVYVGDQQKGFTRDAGFAERGFSVASKIMLVDPGDHAPDKLEKARATSFEETLECADRMHRTGKFKQLRLSNVAAWEVAEIVGICERSEQCIGFVKPTIYQGMYNPARLNPEVEPCIRKFGLSLVTMIDCLAVIEPAAKAHNIPLIEVIRMASLSRTLLLVRKGPLPDIAVAALERAWAIAKSDAPTHWRGRSGGGVPSLHVDQGAKDGSI
ncbi:NADP-dependent oxidoreductase domain-containing protein [Xylariaceae sp. FL0255]|nr:NADP-dependent oxidoreductase domain-containing protein [Xylariaceae sp. FL0255]